MQLSLIQWFRLGGTISLFVIGDIGDYLESRESVIACRPFHAVLDNVIHTLIGLTTWSIIADDPWDLTIDLLLIAIGSSVIDIDHFMAARSFSVKKAMHAPHRGIFHCSGLLFALSLFLLPFRPHWSLLLLVSFVPHHLRDSTRRGLYLFPPYVHSLPISPSVVRLLLPIFPWILVYLRNKYLIQKPLTGVLDV